MEPHFGILHPLPIPLSSDRLDLLLDQPGSPDERGIRSVLIQGVFADLEQAEGG